jgi:hypothetical protein
MEHCGRKILLQDFSRVTDLEEALRIIAAATAFVDEEAARTPGLALLFLTDIEGAHFDERVVKAMQELAKHHKPYVKASALVGLTPLKRVMYRMVMMVTGRNISTFETREQALDWLAAQAG